LGNFDEYFPFDPGYGASANSARWRKMANLWQSDGVIKGYLNELSAGAPSGGNVSISSGGCFIHGYYAEVNPGPQTIAVTGNGSIVAQVDFGTQVCQIYFKQNAVDYGPSTTLNYEQSTNRWEIPLYLYSGGTLSDLRTMISPGIGLAWWGQYSGGASFTVGTNTTSTTAAGLLTPRIPYGISPLGVPALLQATALVTFNNLATAQTATLSLIYQNGQSDMYPGSGRPLVAPVTPGVGGGGSDVSLSMPVSLSMLVPLVTVGKKTAGIIVSAGGGPSIQVSQVTMSMTLIGMPTLN
jgi:hypothetical protein